MRLYTCLLKLQLLNSLAYRFEYLSSIGRSLWIERLSRIEQRLGIESRREQT